MEPRLADTPQQWAGMPACTIEGHLDLDSPSVLNQPFNYILMTTVLIMPHFQLVQSVLKIGFALAKRVG